ncbi:hypothetical protein [Streptomyces sp. NPDC000410]|uniref:hypothetical protein n=1 Tax=Streptomyces sp. NPDC000410 TaxID=3154254 RepID=UPI00331ADF99
MSRETDSSSSGPQGRGGAAYPSGTPPYGSRQYPSLHPTQDAPDERAEPASAPESDEPRTETTLTTRIRINIPGSRPIPPVVMRTPMSESDVDARERTGSVPRPAAADAPGAGAAGAAGAREEASAPAQKPAEEKASSWFAPRKTPAAAPPETPGEPTPPPAPSQSAPPTGAGQRPRSALSDLAADSGAPGPTGPGSPSGAGSANGSANGFGPGGPSGSAPGPANGSANGSGNGFAPERPTPQLGLRPPGGPSGPTTGPATGTSPFAPAADSSPFAPAADGSPFAPPSGTSPFAPGAGAPRMSDDTAELTPQKPAPGPGHGPGPLTAPGGNVSGDTLTSGIPVVPSDHQSPFAPGGGPGTGTGPWPSEGPGEGFSTPDFPGAAGSARVAPSPSASPTAEAQARPSAPAPAPSSSSRPAKKGRSKLVLAGAGAFGALGIAYGAGLLMNHSEVPKGTTVLGVDIGGGTTEQGVAKLEAALGERASTPLQLTVGDKKEQLAPDKAGLGLDSQATVRAASGSDYNPVSVIGSLFGGERVAQPVIPVDEEKLQVALSDLAGSSGSATEATIKFEPNKAVAVPGKAGQSLDILKSMTSVKDAYRAQVETGKANEVELPLGTREPTITKTELDRAMREFAAPAMSGLITIKAGGKQIDFGPARSLPKILSMKAIDGRLVEVYDKKAIEELLDGTFDGIQITKGDGKKHPLSVDDVAQAMQKALRGKTPAERTQTIALDGEG